MLATWILVIFAHVGLAGTGNSNAITTVPGFVTEAHCQAAGKQAKKLAFGTVKEIEFVCLKQPTILSND